MPNYVEQANYLDGDRPAPAWELAQTNFSSRARRFSADWGGRRAAEADPGAVPASLGLVLSNEAVTEAERKSSVGRPRRRHPVSRKLYDVGCLFLDTLFDERPIQRFWFLEVIARIPFSYVRCCTSTSRLAGGAGQNYARSIMRRSGTSCTTS